MTNGLGPVHALLIYSRFDDCHVNQDATVPHHAPDGAGLQQESQGLGDYEEDADDYDGSRPR